MVGSGSEIKYPGSATLRLIQKNFFSPEIWGADGEEEAVRVENGVAAGQCHICQLFPINTINQSINLLTGNILHCSLLSAR
jgi:hypothetical protein